MICSDLFDVTEPVVNGSLVRKEVWKNVTSVIRPWFSFWREFYDGKYNCYKILSAVKVCFWSIQT